MTTTPEIDYGSLAGEQLIELLSTEGDRLSRPAVDEFLRRGDPVVPALVAIIDDESAWSAEGSRFWAPVHAVFILAAIHPPGALDAMVRAMRKASEADIDWIYTVSRDLLAVFGTAALPALIPIARDAAESAHMRDVAAEALARIGREHSEVKEEVASVLRSIVADESCAPDVREFVALCLLEVAAPEDRELLLAHAAGFMFDEDDVEHALRGEGQDLEPAHGWLGFYDEREIQERQIRWNDEEIVRLGAERDAAKAKLRTAKAELRRHVASHEPSQKPYERENPKVGRNDPCPCGSGKKHKKCCGR